MFTPLYKHHVAVGTGVTQEPDTDVRQRDIQPRWLGYRKQLDALLHISPLIRQPAHRFSTREALFDSLYSALATSLDRGLSLGQAPVWLAIAFGSGLLSYFALPHEPSLWALAALGTVLGLACMLARNAYRATIALFLLALIMGVGWGAFTTQRVLAPQLTEEVATGLRGRIVQIEQRPRSRLRLTLEDVALSRVDAEATPHRVRFTTPGQSGDFALGDVVDGFVRLGSPPEPAMPGARNMRRELFFRQIGATGFAYGRPDVVANSADAPSRFDRILQSISQLRIDLQQRFSHTLSGDTAALASALLVGKRDDVSEAAYNALRRAGLAHLLAISGMHMAMMTLAAMGLVSLVAAAHTGFASSQRIQVVTGLVGLIVATGYLALSGASTATQRAFIMVVLALFALVLSRRAITLRGVAIAAVIVLLLHPSAILGPSFQMSFAATFALVAVFTAFSRWRRSLEPSHFKWLSHTQSYPARAVLFVGGIASTSLIAGLATAPFAAFHFSQAAPLSVLGNVLALPIVSLVIMPAGLCALLLTPFALEAPVLMVMGIGIDAVLSIAQTIAAWDASHIAIPAIKPLALVLLTLAGLLAALLPGKPKVLALVPLLGLLITGVWQPRPLVLIERQAATVAFVVQDDGEPVALSRSVERGSSFTVDLWHQRLGLSVSAYQEASAWNCDPLACVTTLPDGRMISHVLHEAALEEDCRLADILVTHLPVPSSCAAPLVVDQSTLRDHGALALVSDGQSDTIDEWPAIANRTRPWERWTNQRSLQAVR